MKASAEQHIFTVVLVVVVVASRSELTLLTLLLCCCTLAVPLSGLVGVPFTVTFLGQAVTFTGYSDSHAISKDCWTSVARTLSYLHVYVAEVQAAPCVVVPWCFAQLLLILL